MNCNEYIDQFLSAQADGQLSAAERCLVEEHLSDCPQCRRRLTEEHELKAQIRRQAEIVKTPADVRLRIRAALGEASDQGYRRRGIFEKSRDSLRHGGLRHARDFARRRRAANTIDSAAYPPTTSRRWIALQLKRAQYLAPVALAVVVLGASTALFKATFRNISGTADYQRRIPAFDFAIDRFNHLSQEFAPNVPPEAFSGDDGASFAWVEGSNPLRHVSAELPDISESYEKVQMPPEFCDFALAGYELVGGRVDHLPNGKPVTYTLYRNQTDSILSIGLKQRISAPEGGYWFDTHALYSYRGYSICLTIYPVGHFASIIVARSPMTSLLRNIATSDVAFWDR